MREEEGGRGEGGGGAAGGRTCSILNYPIDPALFVMDGPPLLHSVCASLPMQGRCTLYSSERASAGPDRPSVSSSPQRLPLAHRNSQSNSRGKLQGIDESQQIHVALVKQPAAIVCLHPLLCFPTRESARSPTSFPAKPSIPSQPSPSVPSPPSVAQLLANTPAHAHAPIQSPCTKGSWLSSVRYTLNQLLEGTVFFPPSPSHPIPLATFPAMIPSPAPWQYRAGRSCCAILCLPRRLIMHVESSRTPQFPSHNSQVRAIQYFQRVSTLPPILDTLPYPSL